MKVSKEKSKIYTIIIAVVVVFLALASLIFWFLNSTRKDNPVNTKKPTAVESEKEHKEPTEVSFVSVGDNLIHGKIYQQAQQRAGGVGYDFNYAYENIKELISSKDIATLNQETIMAQGIKLSSYPTFNSPTELGTFMTDIIGFDVINHATNHVYDKGEKGVQKTLDFWKSKPDIRVVGVYESKEDSDNIRVIDKNGVKTAFLGVTEQTNGISLPSSTNIVLVTLKDEELLKGLIEKAKSLADAVVINVHWGQEYTNIPNAYQKEMARKMADWGATVIIGHHPHVIQPVEYITSKDGQKVLVAYSLGNLISAQDRGERMLGGALEYKLEKDFNNDTITVKDVRFTPIVTHYGSSYSNIKIYTLSEYNNSLAAKHGVKAKTPNFSIEFLNKLLNKVIDKQFL